MWARRVATYPPIFPTTDLKRWGLPKDAITNPRYKTQSYRFVDLWIMSFLAVPCPQFLHFRIEMFTQRLCMLGVTFFFFKTEAQSYEFAILNLWTVRLWGLQRINRKHYCIISQLEPTGARGGVLWFKGKMPTTVPCVWTRGPCWWNL